MLTARGPGGLRSPSAESFPELAEPPPPRPPAPQAFAGPKAHAHRAQLGRWGLLSLPEPEASRGE